MLWLIHSTQSIEFDIDREYVGRVVGAQGSGVNKLRDSLGVKVDFSDEDEKEKEAGKKKKATHQKSRVKVVAPRAIFSLPISHCICKQITGRKENAEEAKKRILSQVERLVSVASFDIPVSDTPPG